MHTSIHVHMHAYTHRHIMRTSGHKNEDGHASACFRCLFPNCTCCFYWFILWFTHPLTAPFAFFYSLNFCFLSIPFYATTIFQSLKRTFIQLVLPSFTPSFVHLLWSPIIIPLHSIRHLLLQACPWSTRPTHSCGCLFAHGLSCNYILISTCVHSLHDTYMSGYMYDQTYEPTSLHAGWAINLVITNFMSCCFRLLTHYIMCHPTPCIKCIRSFIHFINPSIYCQSSTRANLSHSPMPLVCTHTCAHIARHIPSIITDWTHT